MNLDICNDIGCLYFDPLVSALLAGLIVYGIEFFSRKFSAKRKFGKIAGEYLGFGYITKSDSLNLNSVPQTQASIKYLRDNLLEISVKEYPNDNSYEWKGVISLELENYGSLTWNYITFGKEKLGDDKHKFGIKKILINEDDKFIYLYLAESDINYANEYGREIFKRKK